MEGRAFPRRNYSGETAASAAAPWPSFPLVAPVPLKLKFEGCAPLRYAGEDIGQGRAIRLNLQKSARIFADFLEAEQRGDQIEESDADGAR